MDKSKVIKSAVITAASVGVTIAAPHIAPFLLLPLTGLIGEVFKKNELENTDSLGKISINAISGILTNIASSAIWEAPNHFVSEQNEDLSRALAKAYQKSLLAIEDEIDEENDELLTKQAEHILPLIKRRIDRAVKVSTENALNDLFPLRNNNEETTASSVSEGITNRLSSEDFIKELADIDSTKQILINEIKISLHRWLNEEIINQSNFTTFGFSQNEQIPEHLEKYLLKKLRIIIPHELGQSLKSPDLVNSWISFQRSHLQAILTEVKKSKTLSDDEKALIMPLAEQLNEIGKNFPQQLAESATEILRRSKESEDSIKSFIRDQAEELKKSIYSLSDILQPQFTKVNEGVREIMEKLDSRSNTQKFVSTPEPLINLPVSPRRIWGFEDSAQDLLERLKTGEEPISLIVAPNGLGKTTVIKKLLKKVVVNHHLDDDRLKGIIYFDCSLDKISLLRIYEEAGRMLGKDLKALYSQPELEPHQRLERLLSELGQEGERWLIFDNLEALLEDTSGEIKDEEIDQLFEAILTHSHQIRVLLSSQDVPTLKNGFRLSPIPKVTEELKNGLAVREAIALLRFEGATVGLNDASDRLLIEFIQKVGAKPKHLIETINYLKDEVYPSQTLEDLMNDAELFSKFDSQGIGLLSKQIEKQTSAAKQVLSLLAFLEISIPIQIFQKIIPHQELNKAIKRLEASELIFDDQDCRSYRIKDEAIEVCKIDLENPSKEFNSEFLEYCLSQGQIASDRESYKLANEIYECGLRALDLLAKKSIQSDGILYEVTLSIKNAYVLRHLQRSSEALNYAEKSKTFLDEIDTEQQNSAVRELKADNLLILGLVLSDVGDDSLVINYYDEAISICEELCSLEESSEILQKLARILVNKGIKFVDDQKFENGITSYQRAIDIYEKLLIKTSDFNVRDYYAWALVTTGEAFFKLYKSDKALTDENADSLPEFVSYYEKGIEIYKQLVKDSSLVKYSEWLTWALVVQAKLLLEFNEIDRTRHLYEQALNITSKLIEEGSSNYIIYERYGETLSSLAYLYAETDKLSLALEYFDDLSDFYFYLINKRNKTEFVGALALNLIRKGIELSKKHRTNETIEAYDEGIRIITEFKKISQNEKDAKLEKNLSLFYLIKGEFLAGIKSREQEAITSYLNAIEILKDLPESEDDLVSTYRDVGYLYIKLDFVDYAVENYERAIEILKSSNQNNEKTLTLNSLYEKKINCLTWLGEQSQEPSYIDEALDILDNNIQISADSKNSLQFTLLKTKGDILSRNSENTQLAIQCYDEALKITNSIKNDSDLSEEIASIHLGRGRALYSAENLDEAVKSHENAISIYRDNVKLRNSFQNNSGLALALSNLGKILEKQSKINEALKHYDEAIRLEEFNLIENSQRFDLTSLLRTIRYRMNLSKETGGNYSIFGDIILYLSVIYPYLDEENFSKQEVEEIQHFLSFIKFLEPNYKNYLINVTSKTYKIILGLN